MSRNDASAGASTPAAVGKPILHGGDLARARRRFPEAPEPWIDLSTGINPFPYPVPAIAPETWARLPLASDEQALRVAAARRYGAKDDYTVVTAAGSQAIIQILPYLVPRGRVAILAPAYAEHAAAWNRAGHDVDLVNDAEESDAPVLVIVNPNNPTGFLIPAREMLEIAKARAANGHLLVVDEAFMDVITPSESLVPHQAPQTLVLRSFGKMYGLAGLRLGFAITQPELARSLRDALGPWAVPGPALAIGTHALRDDTWPDATRAALAQNASRLKTLLSAAGGTHIGGTPLFALISHPNAKALAQTLGRRGILVREFAAHPTWLRFGIPGSETAWARLAEALGTPNGA
jgi:cobalamin biosynthesis protein CobC